ncbi:type II toxin-antitoxin system RelE/ParE family toxin [Escherichia coli]|nr:type II toxin-antitoxin system RelE/ParE family toxin [Escherichia coli]
MQMKNNITHATKVITAHVPLPMADKIDQMVTRLERSRVWIIRQALSDFVRLYDFLVLSSKPAAARTLQSLTQAPIILLTYPHMGEQLFQFEPREVRRIFAGEYEIRYELTGQTCLCIASVAYAGKQIGVSDILEYISSK